MQKSENYKYKGVSFEELNPTTQKVLIDWGYVEKPNNKTAERKNKKVTKKIDKNEISE